MERDLLLRVGGWTMRLEKGGWLGGKFSVWVRVLGEGDWGVYGFGVDLISVVKGGI